MQPLKSEPAFADKYALDAYTTFKRSFDRIRRSWITTTRRFDEVQHNLSAVNTDIRSAFGDAVGRGLSTLTRFDADDSKKGDDGLGHLRVRFSGQYYDILSAAKLLLETTDELVEDLDEVNRMIKGRRSEGLEDLTEEIAAFSLDLERTHASITAVCELEAKYMANPNLAFADAFCQSSSRPQTRDSAQAAISGPASETAALPKEKRTGAPKQAVVGQREASAGQKPQTKYKPRYSSLETAPRPAGLAPRPGASVAKPAALAQRNGPAPVRPLTPNDQRVLAGATLRPRAQTAKAVPMRRASAFTAVTALVSVPGQGSRAALAAPLRQRQRLSTAALRIPAPSKQRGSEPDENAPPSGHTPTRISASIPFS